MISPKVTTDASAHKHYKPKLVLMVDVTSG